MSAGSGIGINSRKMDVPAVKVKNLAKHFGPISAVDNISFEVSSGELFGFLGPNGAGKTTTINILCTLLLPTSGEAIVNGFNAVKMKNRISETKPNIKYFTGIRYILLFTCAVLLGACIITLGWMNHADFERSVINAELRELLVIAKSSTYDVEKKISEIKQQPEQIAQLIKHINNEEELFSFVIDNKHIILSYPVKGFINKNIFEVSKGVLNLKELSALSAFLEKMDGGDSGTAVLKFPSNNNSEPGKSTTLLAFSRLRGRGNDYFLIVAEGMGALTAPLHRNLRDTLILVGLFFLISIIFTYIFFRMQENRFKMEVTNRALEIINKQLRCDIENYKCIETKLKNLRNPGKDSP